MLALIVNNNLKERIYMSKEKKLVEAITSRDEDFSQWYTDIVKS